MATQTKSRAKSSNSQSKRSAANKKNLNKKDNLKQGDNVEWNSSQGKIKGTVKEKLTEETKIKGHKVAASKNNPEYLVESDKTGAKAAHKRGALKKKD